MANRLRLLGKGTAELQSPVAGFRERSWSCRHACKRRGKSCAAGFVRRRLRRCADNTRKEPMCDRCLRQTYCRIWVSRNRGHLCRSSRAVHVIEDLKDQETTKDQQACHEREGHVSTGDALGLLACTCCRCTSRRGRLVCLCQRLAGFFAPDNLLRIHHETIAILFVRCGSIVCQVHLP